SRVNVKLVVMGLPFTSLSEATTVCVPSARPVGVKTKTPAVPAQAVASTATPSIVKLTEVPGVAVPIKVWTLVILSELELPVSENRPTASAVDELAPAVARLVVPAADWVAAVLAGISIMIGSSERERETELV